MAQKMQSAAAAGSVDIARASYRRRRHRPDDRAGRP
jgi:hypothetical protein